MSTTVIPRKNLRILLISIASALLLIWLFLWPKNAGPYRAIPSQSSVLIDCPGMVAAGRQMLAVKSPALKSALNNVLMQHFWQELQPVERMFHEQQEAVKAFAKNRILAAYSLQPSDSLHPVFLMALPVSLEDVLKSAGRPVRYFPYQFHQQQLYTVHLEHEGRWVFAQKDGILIFSRNSYLVEDALAQLERGGGWWSNHAQLDMIDETAALRLFFRPEVWKVHQTSHFKDQGASIAEGLSNNIRLLGIGLQGTEIQAACLPGGILSGLGGWNPVQNRDILNLLPNHTAFFMWAGFDDRNKFLKNLAPEGVGGDFERYVLPWIGSQCAYVVTEPLSNALKDDALLVLAVRDSIKARKSMEAYGDARGSLVREKTGMFEVFGFPGNSLLAPFIGKGAKGFQPLFAAHLGNCMVFAPSRHALELCIEKYIGNQTLADNTDFLQLAGHFRQEEQAIAAVNGGYLQSLMAQLFTTGAEGLQPWTADAGNLSQLGWLAVSLEPLPGQVTRLHTLQQEQTLPLPVSDIYWKTSLDAPAISPVYSIAQPGLPYGTALLVQDKLSNLYCLDPAGTILWKKHLGSLLLSEIKAFDFYRNGRNCYLFNTKNQVWLLDDAGKEAPGYPTRLQAKAERGLTAVDFDRDGRMYYFIPCENGSTYGFDQYGRALEAWNPLPEAGKTAGPMLHFQNNGKDYLVVLQQNGTLQAFGRDGRPRFGAVKLTGEFRNPPFVEKGKGPLRLICVNTQGTFYTIDLQGKTQSFAVPVKSWEAAPFVLQQLNQKEAGNYALLQDKHLWILNMDRGTGVPRVLASATFPEKQDDLFVAGEQLGLCSRKRQVLRALNYKGEPVEGFPLAGSTPFDYCTVNSENLLICGNGSAIFGYRSKN